MPNIIAPNSYELSGNNIHISYSTTSFEGKPHFTYQDEQQTLNFRGDEIRSAEIEIGRFVSVTIVSVTIHGALPIPDGDVTIFSILLPFVIESPAEQSSVFFQTVGITTDHKFSFVPGITQRDVYTITTLEGRAMNYIC